MKRYIGKYASGQRKADQQIKAERDFIKSLPLAIRKAMKERDQSLITLNGMINGDRDAFITQRRLYDTLRIQVETMIKEFRHV